MNKTLLKRQLFERCEELMRIELQLKALEHTLALNLMPCLDALNRQAKDTRNLLLNQRKTYQAALDETPSANVESGRQLSDLLSTLRAQCAGIIQALSHLTTFSIQPETELYLNSFALNRLLPDALPVTVLASTDATPEWVVQFSRDTVVECLPVLSVGNPVRWVKLLDGFMRYFARQTVQFQPIFEAFPSAETALDAVVPLLSLRLAGPAYYSDFVMTALENDDAVALNTTESILFMALNRFGLATKDMVILHQGLESARQNNGLGQSHDALQHLLTPDLQDKLLKIVEAVIPERLAFTEKAFYYAQLLEERLEFGTLVAAVPMMTSPVQIRDEMDRLDESSSIYPLLSRLTETPATPAQIVNAGMLYKLDRTFGWLNDILSQDSETAWEAVKYTLQNLDNLLLKSIETSEVHRILAQDDLAVPLPV